MKKKIIIEIEKQMRDGDVLVYKDGLYKSMEVHELLPDLIVAKEDIKKMKSDIVSLKCQVAELIAKVKELRGED